GMNKTRYFLERLHVSRLFLGDFDNVESELSFHQIANGSHTERERRLIKLRYHLATAEQAKIAAVGSGAWIFGILAGKFRKIGTLFLLHQEVGGFGLDVRGLLRGFAFGLQKDVRCPYSFRQLIAGQILLVI